MVRRGHETTAAAGLLGAKSRVRAFVGVALQPAGVDVDQRVSQARSLDVVARGPPTGSRAKEDCIRIHGCVKRE